MVLVVDNREKRNAQDINYFFDRFIASGIRVEQRSLPLGDFLWILRVHHSEQTLNADVTEVDNPNPDQATDNPRKKKKATKQKKRVESTDYLLDFIIERKTADDLAASILDGRYEEQKFRLKNCGVNNVIYLVEGTPGQYCKIPESVLKKAGIHT